MRLYRLWYSLIILYNICKCMKALDKCVDIAIMRVERKLYSNAAVKRVCYWEAGRTQITCF